VTPSRFERVAVSIETGGLRVVDAGALYVAGVTVAVEVEVADGTMREDDGVGNWL
jgi:hypothetical protein